LNRFNIDSSMLCSSAIALITAKLANINDFTGIGKTSNMSISTITPFHIWTTMKIARLNITRSNILDAIGDEFGHDLFTSIATNGDGTKMSHKQYYERLAKLVKTGLIKRKNGKYVLTTFGHVIYQLQLLLGKVVNDHSILKAFEG
jgi:hypothetical protein